MTARPLWIAPGGECVLARQVHSLSKHISSAGAKTFIPGYSDPPFSVSPLSAAMCTAVLLLRPYRSSCEDCRAQLIRALTEHWCPTTHIRVVDTLGAWPMGVGQILSDGSCIAFPSVTCLSVAEVFLSRLPCAFGYSSGLTNATVSASCFFIR